MFISILFLIVLFSTISAATIHETITFGSCNNTNRITLALNQCYKVKHKIFIQSNICMFEENLINENSTLFDLLCPNCTSEAEYNASMILVPFNTIDSDLKQIILLFADNLNCTDNILSGQIAAMTMYANTDQCDTCRSAIDGNYYQTYRRLNSSLIPVSQTSSGIELIPNEASSDNSNLLPLASLAALNLIPLCCLCFCLLSILFLALFCCIGIVLILLVGIFSAFSLLTTGSISSLTGFLGWRHYKNNSSEIKILDTLGSGVGGTVYKVLYKNMICAAKKIELFDLPKNSEETTDEENLIMNEINLISSLDNAYVCKYIKHFKEENAIYLLTKLYENGDLSTYLKEHSLKFSQKIRIMLNVAKGLQYLHANDIVHRDLSCRNILLDSDLIASITDFGLSRKFVMCDERMQHTKTNLLPIRWSAPESLGTTEFNYQSDIFMLSRTFYEILMEEIPFKDWTDQAKLIYYIRMERGNLDYSRIESDEMREMLLEMSKYEAGERIGLEEVIIRLERMKDEIGDEEENDESEETEENEIDLV